MKNLKNNIKIIFENTESLEIPIKNIGHFRISNIKEHISSTARSIEKYKTGENLFLEIDKEGNIPFKNLLNEEELTFDRLLEFNDICAIIINIDDKKEEIELPYDGPIEEINELQKTYLSKNGNLYIVIDKEKNIEDVFNKTIIDGTKYKIFKKDIF